MECMNFAMIVINPWLMPSGTRRNHSRKMPMQCKFFFARKHGLFWISNISLVNIKRPRGNIGRAYDSTIDLTKALENHYHPTLALERIQQTHEWLKDPTPLSDTELEQRGWKKGYNLTIWQEMPGEVDSRARAKVILQVLTGGRMGMVGMGPGIEIKEEASEVLRILLP